MSIFRSTFFFFSINLFFPIVIVCLYLLIMSNRAMKRKAAKTGTKTGTVIAPFLLGMFVHPLFLLLWPCVFFDLLLPLRILPTVPFVGVSKETTS